MTNNILLIGIGVELLFLAGLIGFWLGDTLRHRKWMQVMGGLNDEIEASGDIDAALVTLQESVAT